MSKRNCTCLSCTIARVINERFPDGQGLAEIGEILGSLANVSGRYLTYGDAETTRSFIALAVERREAHRVTDEQRAGAGIH